MDRKLSGSIALTKLKHVVETRNGAKGKIKVLVIPIEANYLVEGKEGAYYLPVNVITKSEPDEYGQHGFIGWKADSKIWKAADEDLRLDLKKLPILGNLKDWEQTNRDAEGVLPQGEIAAPADDDGLPF